MHSHLIPFIYFSLLLLRNIIHKSSVNDRLNIIFTRVIFCFFDFFSKCHEFYFQWNFEDLTWYFINLTVRNRQFKYKEYLEIRRQNSFLITLFLALTNSSIRGINLSVHFFKSYIAISSNFCLVNSKSSSVSSMVNDENQHPIMYAS